MPQCLFVEEVLSTVWAKFLKVGDVVTQFLYSRHLLLQKVPLNKISHLKNKQCNIHIYTCIMTVNGMSSMTADKCTLSVP